jgi:isochorismate synthase
VPDDRVAAWPAPRPAAGEPLRCRVREITPSDPVSAFVLGWARTGRGFLWWRPAEGFGLVGAGVAAAWAGPPAMPLGALASWWARTLAGCRRDGSEAEPATGPLLFTGLAFDAADERTASDPFWRPFPPLAAILPARLTTLRHGRAWLTETSAGWADARAAAPAEQALQSPAVSSVTDLPSRETWSRRVGRLTEAFARGDAEKVVLARSKRVTAAQPFAVEQVLHRLARDHAESTVFAVGWGDRCFLGATPELLASTRGTAVRSASLAGSRPRGRTPDEDAALAADLLASEKDRREHDLVVRAVAAALGPLCRTVDVAAEPAILRLPNVQHLLTEVSGEAKASGALLPLVERLHPTPAVGGVPRSVAMAAIRRLEMRTRGWYAGTLGWVDGSGDGDFVVALRSGILHGRSALLYAGCGIVAGSDPEREFAEAEVKFAPLLAALGATQS